ncbi:hypothetical protein ACK2FV_20800 [Clostridioides difficile]
MKGFERTQKSIIFSLRIELADYALCFWEVTVSGCGNGNQSCRIAKCSLEHGQIEYCFMNVDNIHAKSVNTLMTMVLSLRINGEKQI